MLVEADELDLIAAVWFFCCSLLVSCAFRSGVPLSSGRLIGCRASLGYNGATLFGIPFFGFLILDSLFGVYPYTPLQV